MAAVEELRRSPSPRFEPTRPPHRSRALASVAVRQEDLLLDELTSMARAYEESQSFVSLLAHELHSKLRVTERALTDEQVGCEIALENTRALQELVETLLELARGTIGGSSDAGEVMRGVLDDLRGEAAARQAEIRASDLPAVALPQGLLTTVLRNLVMNALEAGARTVEVFARPDGTICVRDDGPGVPAAKTSRIFGVYSGKFGGAGLGLTLCREILRRRGGDLWLELPSTFALQIR